MAVINAYATFRKFLELPPELCLMIWRYAALLRIIELELSNLRSKAILAILYICYKSCEDIRRTYQRLKFLGFLKQMI
jgi:hypothetical protein